MSKSDINNNIKDYFLKKFKKIKIESPIHNLSEASFKYRQKTSLNNNTNKLPILKKQENQRMNSSTRSVIENSKESKTSLLNLKKGYNQSMYINKGIVWYNNNKIKIPRLIIPQGNINSLNNSLSTDRKQFLSQIKNKIKINNINNNNYYCTKRMEELFLQRDDQKKINEVLQLKNDNNNNILVFDRKENKVFELLLKKLGINKNNEDKIIKKISVGILNQKKSSRKKRENIKKNLRNFRNNLYDKYNSLKYFEKDFNKIDSLYKSNKSSSLIMKKNQINEQSNKKVKEKDIDIEEKIKQFKRIHFKNINNEIQKIRVEFKSIDNKLNECFFKAKDNFENEMKKQFSDCNY